MTLNAGVGLPTKYISTPSFIMKGRNTSTYSYSTAVLFCESGSSSNSTAIEVNYLYSGADQQLFDSYFSRKKKRRNILTSIGHGYMRKKTSKQIK